MINNKLSNILSNLSYIIIVLSILSKFKIFILEILRTELNVPYVQIMIFNGIYLLNVYLIEKNLSLNINEYIL